MYFKISWMMTGLSVLTRQSDIKRQNDSVATTTKTTEASYAHG